MRVGSLFSGGGGGDLGLERAGHETVFGCEIDDKARAVFRRHHPNIPIYHDVREVTRERLFADGVPLPDLIFGGSPCQDLSIGGSRTGLDGERSGLFREQARIADELNVAVLWENVVGSFSSNGGNDFAEVIGSLAGSVVDIPGGGWRNSGVCIGSHRVAMWRVFNAQYFGVPQRRRRVFVLAVDRAVARRAVSVLFESGRGAGDAPPNGHAQEETGAAHRASAGSDDGGHRPMIEAFREVTWALCAAKGRHPGATLQDMEAGICVPVDGHGGAYIRRPTNKEVERLMGWPDDWTRYGIDDDGNAIELSVTNRYHLCGNGIVPNVTEWIGHRLMAALG